MHLAFCTTTLRVSPAVITILFLYAHYLATLYLFFQKNTPVTLSIHSLFYLNILFLFFLYSFIPFKYYIFIHSLSFLFLFFYPI
jgi:hypothetical protein